MYKNLRLGDVIYVPLVWLSKHYGIVVQEGNLFQEPVIRTVLWGHEAPVNQNISTFLDGRAYKKISYPSDLERACAVQNALNIRKFDYHLVVNNCENFWKKVHKLPNISTQSVVGCVAILAIIVMLSNKIRSIA